MEIPPRFHRISTLSPKIPTPHLPLEGGGMEMQGRTGETNKRDRPAKTHIRPFVSLAGWLEGIRR